MSSGKKKGITADVYDVGSAGTGIKTFSKKSFTEKDILLGKRVENMLLSDGALKCIEAPHGICANLSGSSDKKCFCEGETKYFISGSSIYKINEDETASCIGDGVITGSPSPFYKYDGVLYVIDSAGTLIEVGENSCTVTTIQAPLCYKNVSADGLTYTESAPVNIFTPYIEIQFPSLKASQKTPDCIKVSDIVSVTGNNGRDLKSYCRFSYTSGVCKITSTSTFNLVTTVKAKLSNDFLEQFAALKNAFSGSREIFEMNVGGETKNACLYDGKLCLFDFIARDNLSPEMQEVDVSGANAIVPLDDEFYLFSENNIKKLTEDGEGNFTIAPVRSEVGCDIPGSISGDEKKIIFANSKRGIFCIGKYGMTGENEVLRVSYNVKPILEELTPEQMLSACGICAESKYYFFAGGRLFIWNWDKTIPICLKEEDDELLLDWNVIYGMPCDRAVGHHKNTVFFVSGSNLQKYIRSEFSGQSLTGTYKSERLSPASFDKCVLCRLKISANITGSASLSLYFDGGATPDVYSLSGTGIEKVYSLRLPPREFFSFSMLLSGRQIAIYGYELEYYSA